MRRAAIFGLALAAGCGGGQTRGTPFDPEWADDHGAAMAAFARSFAKARVPAGADVAIGVVEKKAIVGVSLAGGQPWTFAHELHGRPALAGSVVVATGGGELFALDANTGRLLWSRVTGGRIRGAGDDGATTVVSLIPTTGFGSVVLAVARDGSVVRQIEAEAAIGVPAVAGDALFLPWQGRFVSVYDLPSGEERARTELHHRTSRAFALGGAIFLGERSVTRVDEGIAGAARALKLPAPMGGLPGEPVWMRDGTEWLEREADAFDKVRLYARPATGGGPLAVTGGRFASTYFRVALGFDASNGALAWARLHDADFMGGAAYDGGFALCDGKGRITFLDARTGAVTGGLALGQEVVSCQVQADGFAKKAGARAEPLADQIAAVVLRPEPELAAIQRPLLAALSKLDDDSATRAILDLCASDHAALDLARDARAALAKRRAGAPLLLAALAGRYDFLAGVKRPPPVGPLADALAAMKEARAAPLLAGYLGDPSVSDDDVAHAAAALSTLATAAEAGAIEAFFTMHHASSDRRPLDDALVSAAAALMRLGARDPVAAAVSDPATPPALKARLVELFKPRAG